LSTTLGMVVGASTMLVVDDRVINNVGGDGGHVIIDVGGGGRGIDNVGGGCVIVDIGGGGCIIIDTGDGGGRLSHR